MNLLKISDLKSEDLFMCNIIYKMFFSISPNTGSLHYTVCNMAFLWRAREILE